MTSYDFKHMIYGLINIVGFTILVQVPNVVAFGPFPPPRFDEFSERLIGSWTKASDGTMASVEEVMRSCGGAVQGIREPLRINNVEEEESHYLNRANDGFIFINNGSYSFGPVNQDGNDDDLHLSNIMVGSSSRIIISSSLQSGTTARLQTRSFRADPDTELAIKTKQVDALDKLPSIDFGSTIKCSMPSAGQPWMLQRAKWQQNKRSIDGDKKEESTENTSERKIRYWSMSQSATDFSNWIGLPEEGEEESNVVHMGITCESTGTTSVIARYYSPKNVLKSVIFLEGRSSNQ